MVSAHFTVYTAVLAIKPVPEDTTEIQTISLIIEKTVCHFMRQMKVNTLRWFCEVQYRGVQSIER